MAGPEAYLRHLLSCITTTHPNNCHRGTAAGESRPKPASRRPLRSLEPRLASQPHAVRLPLPRIEELIEFGEIMIGNKCTPAVWL